MTVEFETVPGTHMEVDIAEPDRGADGEPWIPQELQKVADMAKAGGDPPRATVRTLLSWFHAQRRGSFIVWLIGQRLKLLGIRTLPHFNAVWLDSEVSFVPLSPEEAAEGPLDEGDGRTERAGSGPSTGVSATLEAGLGGTEAALVGGAIEDPTYRIGKLEAANKPVTSVGPNQSVREAATIMLANGFSQLPVMPGERDVKGILTWENIGARLALGRSCDEVRECMTSPQVIGSEKSLFAAIEVIAQYQYVLVRGADNKISGIVTAADLSLQFQQLTEPFLLLSEIEQHIRRLIGGKFTIEELRLACDPNDSDREIEDVADLTMGEYVRLLENPERWGRLGTQIDRASFIEQLKAVRRIRNDVMHFDPDPLGANDLLRLRQFVNFMRSLQELDIF